MLVREHRRASIACQGLENWRHTIGEMFSLTGKVQWGRYCVVLVTLTFDLDAFEPSHIRTYSEYSGERKLRVVSDLRLRIRQRSCRIYCLELHRTNAFVYVSCKA